MVDEAKAAAGPSAESAAGPLAEPAAGPVALVGLQGGRSFGAGAERALRAASVLAGSRRHLADVDSSGPARSPRRLELDGDIDAFLERICELRDQGEKVCIVASGDPGFFGIGRLTSARLGTEGIVVYPAPSSVALAFARLALHWDDAVVVSAHGRPLEHAVSAVVDHPKVAVLVSPDQPAEALGQLLLAEEVHRRIAVLSRLGEPGETVWEGDAAGLAAGTFEPLSVVICLAPSPAGPGLAWGRSAATYAHREGMITKDEVRAVALGKLELPPAGVMWDIGAGSGSVAAECARLAPGLRVFAVERRPDDVDRLRRNLAATSAAVVAGEAPGILSGLPDPDRVFVGGGGLAVLDAALERLRPGGTVVATYAALDRAAAAARRLGSVVQMSVSRGVPVGADGSLRLAAENPVFVCWGPS